MNEGLVFAAITNYGDHLKQLICLVSLELSTAFGRRRKEKNKLAALPPAVRISTLESAQCCLAQSSPLCQYIVELTVCLLVRVQ